MYVLADTAATNDAIAAAFILLHTIDDENQI
jgi:hypothetical protein